MWIPAPPDSSSAAPLQNGPGSRPWRGPRSEASETKGAQGGYIAQVDSIRIGSLEFRDCLVRSQDRKDIIDIDGLIGTDVFSSYLVTLDYPCASSSCPSFRPDQAKPRRGRHASRLKVASSRPVWPRFAASPRAPRPLHQPSDERLRIGIPLGPLPIVPTLFNRKTQATLHGGHRRVQFCHFARGRSRRHQGSRRPPDTVKGVSGEVAKVSSSERRLFHVRRHPATKQRPVFF